jgi:hypothetical protein
MSWLCQTVFEYTVLHRCIVHTMIFEIDIESWKRAYVHDSKQVGLSSLNVIVRSATIIDDDTVRSRLIAGGIGGGLVLFQEIWHLSVIPVANRKLSWRKHAVQCGLDENLTVNSLATFPFHGAFGSLTIRGALMPSGYWPL